MTDFEKFESELNELYGNYVLKFRILSYLEKELEGHFRNQREKVQVNDFLGILSSIWNFTSQEVSRQYMQPINSDVTEQDQEWLNRQLQEPNDEIGVHSDEEEDGEDSDEDE